MFIDDIFLSKTWILP